MKKKITTYNKYLLTWENIVWLYMLALWTKNYFYDKRRICVSFVYSHQQTKTYGRFCIDETLYKNHMSSEDDDPQCQFIQAWNSDLGVTNKSTHLVRWALPGSLDQLCIILHFSMTNYLTLMIAGSGELRIVGAITRALHLCAMQVCASVEIGDPQILTDWITSWHRSTVLAL